MNLAQMLLMARPLRSYQQVILADKPVAYWPLNETSGTVANDLSGNGNNGTISGTVTLGQPGIPASPGSYAFNNGTITAANKYISGDATVSMEAWVKSSNNENMNFFNAASSSSTGAAFYLGLTGTSNNIGNGFPGSGNGVYFAQTGDDAWAEGATGFDGDWHYIALVRQGAEVVIYFDGAPPQGCAQTASSWTPIENSPFGLNSTPNTVAQPIQIGNSGNTIWNAGLAYWVGNIANVAIYNKALTAAQILNHYNAGIA